MQCEVSHYQPVAGKGLHNSVNEGDIDWEVDEQLLSPELQVVSRLIVRWGVNATTALQGFDGDHL